MSTSTAAPAPSRSIDSAQSSPHSHLPNSLYSLFPSMGDDNNHSEPWNKTYWILAAVVSFVILWIACSYYGYRQHLKKAAARQAQYQARLSALRFGPRTFTVRSETVELQEVDTVNAVPRDPDMRAVVHM